jgi:hypothetical protein
VLQSVQEEAQIAKDLAARNPSLAEGTNLIASLDLAISAYYYNDATATVDAVTRAVERITETANFAAYHATQTVEATLNHATGTAYAISRATYQAWWATDMACWAAAGAACTATPPSPPSLTPEPSLTRSPSAPSTRALSGLARTAAPSPPVTPTPLAQPEPAASQPQDLVLTLAVGVISLVIVVYLVVRRYRRQDVDDEDVAVEDER